MADVRIVHEDGRSGTVPEANLAAAQKLGWRTETEGDAAERQRGSLLETAGRGVAVGAVGAALAAPKLAHAAGSLLLPGAVRRGASKLSTAAGFGEDPLANLSGRQFLEDVSAVGAHLSGGESEVSGRETREQLQSDETANPVTATVSELAGNLVGAGGLARAGAAGAGAAGRALAGLGASARAARIGASIAGAAIEGAGLGADAASEKAWLRNETATAEQTLAGIGMGGLFGGATGGLFGAIGSRGAAKGARLSEQLAGAAAREGTEEGLAGAAARVERAAGEEAGAVAESKPAGWIDSQGRAGPGTRAGGVVEREASTRAAPLTEAAESSAGARARKWISGVADDEMVNAISRGNKTALRDLGVRGELTAARKREVGGLLHELGIGAAGRSEADMAQIAQQRVAEQGGRIGKVLEVADARVAEEGAGQFMPKSTEALFPKIEALKAKLTEGAMLPEEQKLAGYIERNTAYLRKKAATGELLPSDIQAFRRKVDSLAKWARAEPGPKAEAATELRRVLESHLEEEVGKTAPELLGEYQRAKKLYAAANWAADTLGERVQIRSGANRLLSPTDYLMGATAIASGNPLVAALGAVGNKLVRERGWSTAAVLAKKLAGEAVDVSAAPLAAVPTARNLQTMIAHTEQHISDGIGSFFGKGPATAAPRAARYSTATALRSKDLGEALSAYREHAREVQTVASVPEVAASRLASMTGQDLAAVAPGLHGAMAQVASRGANYLAANMPAPPVDPDSITPQLDEPPPISATDLAMYANRVEGVENPLSLVDDLKANKVSPEKTDAVKTVYPELFDRIRANVFAQLADRKEPVPHHQRLVLDLALDGNGTLEPSLRPESLAVMRMANKAVAASAKPPPASGRVPKISGMFSTRTAQITAPKGT